MGKKHNPNRTQLETCQITISENGCADEEQECCQPAVAVWNWGEGGDLFVCEEHDADISAHEENEGTEETRQSLTANYPEATPPAPTEGR